jgi:DNA-binding transcriptional ArsR family regulator
MIIFLNTIIDYFPVKLSKNALKILERLARRSEADIEKISKETAIQPPNISRALKELDEFGTI